MHDFRSYIFAARIASDSGPTCSLYENCQRRGRKAVTVLSNRAHMVCGGRRLLPEIFGHEVTHPLQKRRLS